MTKSEFIAGAIKNGHGKDLCEGWDWIRSHLSALDYIFQTEEYKKCNGMKYLCEPLLFEDDELSYEEQKVLNTSWYLNNERVYKEKEERLIKEITADGYSNITNDKSYHNKKLKVAILTDETIVYWDTKLFWAPVDNHLMVLKPKCRRRGKWIDNTIYVKFGEGK